jgi:hypothetical protein
MLQFHLLRYKEEKVRIESGSQDGKTYEILIQMVGISSEREVRNFWTETPNSLASTRIVFLIQALSDRIRSLNSDYSLVINCSIQAEKELGYSNFSNQKEKFLLQIDILSIKNHLPPTKEEVLETISNILQNEILT